MQAISFENVSYSYKQADAEYVRNAVDGVTLDIEEGKFIALLGANGSGKSTLAKLINGLLLPVSGEVKVFGKPTVGDDQNGLFEIRRRVGMVFQNPDNQQIASIVEDDIAFGPENIGIDREEIGRRIDRALKVTDMEAFRYSQVSRLSGGQKQRIAIAGALALEPDILILDESTSMLDPKGRKEVMEVARSLNREKGMTVINITHYMDEAAEADEIYLLKEGKLVKSGTPDEVFSDTATIRECGLELPRPAMLAEKLKAAGIISNVKITSKEELAEEICKSLRKN